MTTGPTRTCVCTGTRRLWLATGMLVGVLAGMWVGWLMCAWTTR